MPLGRVSTSCSASSRLSGDSRHSEAEPPSPAADRCRPRRGFVARRLSLAEESCTGHRRYWGFLIGVVGPLLGVARRELLIPGAFEGKRQRVNSSNKKINFG